MDELYPLDWSLDSASVAKASVTAENARLQDCEQPPAPSSHSSNSLHIYCLQALVQNRLSQLDVEVCPSHSELSSFVDWIGWSDTDRQYLPTYLLLGNCWKGPQPWYTIHCCWGTLKEDEYYKRCVLAATDNIPVSILQKLSSIARQKFENADRMSRFHFPPGFVADFSPSAATPAKQDKEDLHVQEEGSTEHDCKRLKPSEVAVAGEPNAATQGSAALSHDKTGGSVLSASFPMTEDEIIDVFDNIACCKRAHDKDHEYRTSYQVQDPLHLAFKRLQCKLRKPQADAVCRWATHAHLLLTPLDKADESLRDSGNSTFHNNMYTGFDANKVHPTHRATAISAVSAVAIVNSHQLSNQQHVNALLSWRYPLQLVPKLKHSQQPELSPQAELSLQPQLSPQPEQSPQPELSQQHGRSPQLEHSPQLELDAMTQHVQRSLSSQQPGVTEFQSAAQLAGLEMPQASNTDLLQINFREVLGHGNTGVVFAGHYQGQEVAVKVADPYYSVREQSCKAERIIQEVWTYQQMQGIPAVYGTLVPELLAFIRLPHDTFILVVSKQGQSLSDYVDAHKCVPDAAKVLDSLSKLHSCGVIHGGPRFDNITFRPDCTDVCFIDLQRAHVRNYCWKANSLVHDRSMRQWRKPNYDEQLAQGSESLAKQIMEQIECRTKEHEYVSNLLAQDYSQLTGSCAKFQRGKFPVNY